MEATEHQYDDHSHQSYASNIEYQGQQHSTSSEGAEYSIVTENQAQQNLSASNGAEATATNHSFAGVQANNSFHSVSSGDSAAEMARYFPNVQTPNSSLSFGLQQLVEGQTQSTAASNTAATTNLNTVNAGPYIPVSAPNAAQQLVQPTGTSFMAQNQQQQQRPTGQPQRPQGIPSYSSHIEGLSVSQAVVNDVLVDLQTKVLNETFQQHQDEASNGIFLEPLPPIYIHAPQPTVILRSDLSRLRAELNSRVRPPVVYRHPANANQFQAPRFPGPQQPFNPQGYYGQYPNAAYASR